MRTVGVMSLGCKVNAYESEYVINLLKEHGYIVKDFNDTCDAYIINTCTVTNAADVKSRKTIRNAIRKNKDACIVAMGCFIEADKNLDIPGLDIAVGNKNKTKIVDLLDEWFEKKEKMQTLYGSEKEEFEDMFIEDFPGRTRAFIKIQDGCENFCSYCIIPFVRGKCCSKAPEKVIEEAKTLTEHGYKEIVLTGIHTGNYGRDLDTDFAALLKELVKIEKLERLRISSIEITELNDEVLDVIKNNKVIVDHLHIPLQAGSNEILKAMNRKYDLDYFFNKVKQIREIRKDISLTTDVIVGFPGETEELFQETIDTCKKLELAKIHVFPYSVREGTVAEHLPNQVDGGVKKERARRLLLVSKELEMNYFNKFMNKEVEVLIEEVKDGKSIGHTGNYLHVLINKELKHNEMVKVKITSIDYPYCIGE